MKNIIAIFLIASMPLLQSCAIGVLAAGVGYAVSSGRESKAKLLEAKSKYLERYNGYKLGMENINLEREKAGLEARPILEFEEWLNTQPLTSDEQELFAKQEETNKPNTEENESENDTSETNFSDD